MGAVLISLGGGGGVGSDELTATLGDVLKGKTVVTSDTGDEIGVGTLELTGDVAVGDVLSGKTFYGTDAKTKLTGIMPDNGAVSPDALAAGDSYTIPAGHHNGSGKVTTKSLAEQTADAILDPQFLLEGYSGYDDGILKPGTMRRVGNYPSAYLTTTDGRRVIVNDWGTNDCWVIYNSDGQYRALINVPVTGYYDGNDVISVPASRMAVAGGLTADKMPVGKSAFGIAGTLAVTSAINFSATTLSDSAIRISWTNPSKGPWSGVFIQMSTSSYPGASGGTRKYNGTGSSSTPSGTSYVDITGLSVGTTYYFTCTSYCDPLAWGSSYNVSATTQNIITSSTRTVTGASYLAEGWLFSRTPTIRCWDDRGGYLLLYGNFSNKSYSLKIGTNCNGTEVSFWKSGTDPTKSYGSYWSNTCHGEEGSSESVHWTGTFQANTNCIKFKMYGEDSDGNSADLHIFLFTIDGIDMMSNMRLVMGV